MVLAMAALQTCLDQLGDELVNCGDGCAGIWQDRKIGVLPRCLILERPNSEGRGCLVAGLNPGTSSPGERNFYIQHDVSYDTLKHYWQSSVAQIPYYSKLRRLIGSIGLTGPIVWSDLAKCENPLGVKNQLPPLQTLRHCTQRFLFRELELIPLEWPVLGIGWEAYRALAYRVPRRAVVGIPHPTGAWGAFAQLFVGGAMKEEIHAKAINAMHPDEPKAVWLGRIKNGA
jgi:hypothetical protein